MLKNLAAAAAFAAAPLAASAITINDFGTITDFGPEINGIEIASVEFTNGTGSPITIDGTVSASANTLDALSALRFGFSDTEDDDTVSDLLDPADFSSEGGAGGSGSGNLTAFGADVGETFYLVFRDGDDTDLSDVVTTFQVNPTPIPLPAAAWMMLASLGGLGALAARRRNA